MGSDDDRDRLLALRARDGKTNVRRYRLGPPDADGTRVLTIVASGTVVEIGHDLEGPYVDIAEPDPLKINVTVSFAPPEPAG